MALQRCWCTTELDDASPRIARRQETQFSRRRERTAAPRNALDVRSSFNDTATAEQLAALASPVLVICGDRSPEIVRAIGRGMLGLLPNAHMDALAGANHGMLDSHPEAVASLIAG